MATLSSSSTDDQVFAEYDNCASYAEDNSADKCRRFMTAARIILRRLPRLTGDREANLQLSPDLIQKEIDRAYDWLVANGATASDASSGSGGSSGNASVGPGGGVTYADLSSFRR